MDSSQRRRSEIGGEVGELEELLGMMAEARDQIGREMKNEAAGKERNEVGLDTKRF